eukprot:31416-Pelagococcus_subviridis.AAC.8
MKFPGMSSNGPIDVVQFNQFISRRSFTPDSTADADGTSTVSGSETSTGRPSSPTSFRSAFAAMNGSRVRRQLSAVPLTGMENRRASSSKKSTSAVNEIGFLLLNVMSTGRIGFARPMFLPSGNDTSIGIFAVSVGSRHDTSTLPYPSLTRLNRRVVATPSGVGARTTSFTSNVSFGWHPTPLTSSVHRDGDVVRQRVQRFEVTLHDDAGAIRERAEGRLEPHALRVRVRLGAGRVVLVHARAEGPLHRVLRVVVVRQRHLVRVRYLTEPLSQKNSRSEKYRRRRRNRQPRRFAPRPHRPLHVLVQDEVDAPQEQRERERVRILDRRSEHEVKRQRRVRGDDERVVEPVARRRRRRELLRGRARHRPRAADRVRRRVRVLGRANDRRAFLVHVLGPVLARELHGKLRELLQVDHERRVDDAVIRHRDGQPTHAADEDVVEREPLLLDRHHRHDRLRGDPTLDDLAAAELDAQREIVRPGLVEVARDLDLLGRRLRDSPPRRLARDGRAVVQRQHGKHRVHLAQVRDRDAAVRREPDRAPRDDDRLRVSDDAQLEIRGVDAAAFAALDPLRQPRHDDGLGRAPRDDAAGWGDRERAPRGRFPLELRRVTPLVRQHERLVDDVLPVFLRESKRQRLVVQLDRDRHDVRDDVERVPRVRVAVDRVHDRHAHPRGRLRDAQAQRERRRLARRDDLRSRAAASQPRRRRLRVHLHEHALIRAIRHREVLRVRAQRADGAEVQRGRTHRELGDFFRDEHATALLHLPRRRRVLLVLPRDVELFRLRDVLRDRLRSQMFHRTRRLVRVQPERLARVRQRRSVVAQAALVSQTQRQVVRGVHLRADALRPTRAKVLHVPALVPLLRRRLLERESKRLVPVHGFRRRPRPSPGFAPRDRRARHVHRVDVLPLLHEVLRERHRPTRERPPLLPGLVRHPLHDQRRRLNDLAVDAERVDREALPVRAEILRLVPHHHGDLLPRGYDAARGRRLEELDPRRGEVHGHLLVRVLDRHEVVADVVRRDRAKVQQRRVHGEAARDRARGDRQREARVVTFERHDREVLHLS